MFKRINQFLSSLMLKDILTGMAITGKYLFKPKFTVQYPEEKDAAVPTFSWSACIAPLSKWGRALHRL
jgi:NADH-quinone oxidoreductase subunit I